MSNKPHNTARTNKPILSAMEEEELYFQDTNPRGFTIAVDHLKKDRICTLCGHWQSEHPWDMCSEPNWL